jgi:protoporphyrinogen oxidase
MKQIILGGGLSGLIWSVYHPDSVIIEPGELGGMVHSNMGPMMLHATEEVKDFIRKIGLEPKTRIVQVGYTRDLQSIFPEPPDKNFRRDYYHHSRLIPNGHNVSRSSMSAGSSCFIAIDIPMQDIIEKTIEYIKQAGVSVIPEKVEGIHWLGEGTTIKLENTEISEYTDEIISTIPMTIFQKLIREPMLTPPNALTKIFVNYGHTPPEAYAGLDYVYVVPNHQSRLTRIILDDTITYEYTIMANDDPQEQIPYLIEGQVKTSILRGVIRRNKNITHWKNIRFLGRTARWCHHIKLNDVIMEAQEDVK